MTDHVTATDIADLLHRLRNLSNNRPADPVEQAAVLARKAELLARIADQHADEWGPNHPHTLEAREIAFEAQAIAANANRLVNLHRPAGGAKSEENPAPF